jgi:molybdopterin synthase sulfur carrier subunit
VSVTVRLFAAAAEAAGTEQLAVDATTVADLEHALDQQFGADFAHVRRQCSIMVAGVRSESDATLAEGSTVDVLPPFAGG